MRKTIEILKKIRDDDAVIFVSCVEDRIAIEKLLTINLGYIPAKYPYCKRPHIYLDDTYTFTWDYMYPTKEIVTLKDLQALYLPEPINIKFKLPC